jgi:hypothetical protein
LLFSRTTRCQRICAEIQGANRQLRSIEARDLSGHAVTVRELDDFVAHPLGGNVRRHQRRRQDHRPAGSTPMPRWRHSNG